jgi:hypothetical protein
MAAAPVPEEDQGKGLLHLFGHPDYSGDRPGAGLDYELAFCDLAIGQGVAYPFQSAHFLTFMLQI